MVEIRIMNLPKGEQVVECLCLEDLPPLSLERVFSNEYIQNMVDAFTLQGVMGFLLAYAYWYDADYLRSETGLFMNTNDLQKYFIY